jgi:hypothetical protein
MKEGLEGTRYKSIAAFFNHLRPSQEIDGLGYAATREAAMGRVREELAAGIGRVLINTSVVQKIALTARTLVKVLYCFHQNNECSKCEVVHTHLPGSVPTIHPSEFGLLAGGDACACITLSLLLQFS